MQDLSTILSEITNLSAWGYLIFWLKLLSGIYTTLCVLGFVFLFMKNKTLQKTIKEVQEVVNDVQYPAKPATVFEQKWLNVKELLKSEHFSDYRAAIIDADNLLDEALSQSGYKGGNLGDRLKQLDKSKLSNIEELWQARKLRNSFVHTPDYQPKRMEIEAAINIYERSLRELEFLSF
jgi:hypothetical protein